jgi:hypothetical protein
MHMCPAQYANDVYATMWAPAPSAFTYVRRRRWVRICKRKASLGPTAIATTTTTISTGTQPSPCPAPSPLASHIHIVRILHACLLRAACICAIDSVLRMSVRVHTCTRVCIWTYGQMAVRARTCVSAHLQP